MTGWVSNGVNACIVDDDLQGCLWSEIVACKSHIEGLSVSVAWSSRLPEKYVENRWMSVTMKVLGTDKSIPCRVLLPQTHLPGKDREASKKTCCVFEKIRKRTARIWMSFIHADQKKRAQCVRNRVAGNSVQLETFPAENHHFILVSSWSNFPLSEMETMGRRFRETSIQLVAMDLELKERYIYFFLTDDKVHDMVNNSAMHRRPGTA